MALREKARIETPKPHGRAKPPAAAIQTRPPARSAASSNGHTSRLSEHAPLVQRARESTALQRKVGNARLDQMMQSRTAAPVHAGASLGLAGSKTAGVVPRVTPILQERRTPAPPTGRKASRSEEKEPGQAPAQAKPLAVASEKEAGRSQPPVQAPSAGGPKAAASDQSAEAPAAPAETKAAAPGDAKQKSEASPRSVGESADGTKKGSPESQSAGEGSPPPEGSREAVGKRVSLHIPEPPTEVSPATARRIHGVQTRAGGTAAAHAALPGGAKQVGDARQSVTQPDAEAKAHAQADLIAMLGEQPAPSPEIVKLCERIRQVIRDKRPPDEDALMEAKPEGEAVNAGNQLNSTVESETKKVQDNYGAIDNPPAGAAPQKGDELPGQPATAATPGINAKAATPDAVPPGNVSLDADAADSKKKMQDAGMETPAAQLVQGGPIAEARGAQGELDQAAKEDPAKVLAGQKQALAKAEEDMASLQQEALAALTTSRATTVKGSSSRQHGMVGSEESMRTRASADAQQIFTAAQKSVTSLLKPVAANAISKWEAAKNVLVSQFKSDLAIVQKRVDERHAGVGGFIVGLWDAVTGLPGWAEEAYTKAEKNFGDGVIAKITEISVEVNTVIATCQAIIKDARQRITKIFSDLPGSLGAWAAEQQTKFDGQLDQLNSQALSARDAFNKDLRERASEAVESFARKPEGWSAASPARSIGSSMIRSSSSLKVSSSYWESRRPHSGRSSQRSRRSSRTSPPTRLSSPAICSTVWERVSRSSSTTSCRIFSRAF